MHDANHVTPSLSPTTHLPPSPSGTIDTFADTPGWCCLSGLGWAICFAVLMHVLASMGAMLIIGSSQIPHASELEVEAAAPCRPPLTHHLPLPTPVEQTLVFPFGILACLRWCTVVIDLSSTICTSFSAESVDT